MTSKIHRTPTRTLQPQNYHRKAIENARRVYGKEPEYHIANLGELACAQCECVLSTGKCADGMYGHLREGALDLGNGAFPEKTPQNFGPSLPVEYRAAFSQRKEAPEVRRDLTDTHTHRQADTATTSSSLRMRAEG